MAGRSARTKSANPKSRRAEILAAAAELFAERGYAATGIDQIGAAAGITGGGVYRHFDSKLELFREVVAPLVKRRATQLAVIAEETGSPKKVLRLLVDNMIDGVQEDRSIAAAVWRELRHLDVEGTSWFDRIHALHTREFVRTLLEIFPELSKAEAEARTQAFFGAAFTAAEVDSPLPREDLRRLLREAGLDILLC